MDVGGDLSTENPRYIWCACAALHQVNIREVKKKKARGFFLFFKTTILLIYHQTFTVASANSAPLNQVLKYKDSALQTNWILSMKIGHIIQRCACLLPYLKGTAPCYIMLLDRKRSENPSVSPGRPASAAPSSFLAPCAARSPKSRGSLIAGKISRRETPLMMMWMDGRRRVKSRACH